MKKYKKIILISIFILLILLILIKLLCQKDTIFYIKADGIYSYNKKANKIDDYQYGNIQVSDNKKIIVYNKLNNLYISKNNKKSKLIEKEVYSFNLINDRYLIYEKNQKLFFYNIDKDKSKKLEIINGYNISEDKNNLLYFKNGTLNIFSLNKFKILKQIKEVSDYKCINESCTKISYINNNRELKIGNNDKTLDKNIIKILDSNKNNILYVSMNNGKYNLKILIKGKHNITLDTSKKSFDRGIIEKNKVHYLSAGVYKKSKINGKSKKTITKDVDDIIDNYKNKMILLKGKDLYLNDNRIAEFIDTNSIRILKDKIYYLKIKEDIPALYVYNGKKEKLIAKNVGKIIIENNNLYYIGDYNISKKFGNLYKIGSNKIIDKRVISIITNK